MLDATTFFSLKDNRAKAGYGSAWLVKMPGDTKFSLVGLTTEVPYVFGDVETIEVDFLQSPVFSQIEGKRRLEQTDVPVAHHRDNDYRFNKIIGVGRTLEFMSINREYVGYTFTGTVRYKPNNATNDVDMATVTITPSDAQETPIYNARDMIMPTLYFKSPIPDTIKVGDKIDLSVFDDVSVTVTAKSIEAGTNEETDATSDVVSTTLAETTINKAGLYAITVSAEGYASWTTTVYVEN